MENLHKIRSESQSVKVSRSAISKDCSLPRGEYIQNVIGPKLKKNIVQPQPISHKVNDDDDDDDENDEYSFENSPTDYRHERVLSTKGSESQASSDDENPALVPVNPNQFYFQSTGHEESLSKHSSNFSSLLVQKPPEKFFTPVIGKKKMDLYKFTIIQNASKNLGPYPEGVAEKVSEDKKQNEINKVRNNLANTVKGQSEAQNGENSYSNQIVVHEGDDNQNPLEMIFPVKRLVFDQHIDEKSLQKHVTLLLRGLNYSTKLLKRPPMSYIESRQIVLKELKKKNTKTLLLDLDETLITSCSHRDGPDKILIPDGDKNHPIMIKIRPYAKEFLRRMKEHFELLVFTASCSLYAETVVKELDPEKKYISYILDRSFCLETKNGFFIKDLRIIKNRELKNMILVDNLVHSFGFQIENGVPILEWTGNKNDQELKHLAEYLLEAQNYDDVRDYNREKFRLMELSEAKIEDMIDL